MDNVHGRNKSVPEELSDLAVLRAQTSDVLGAARNRAFTTNNATVPTPVTAGMTLNFAAISAVPKLSGIFDIDISVAWSGATTGDTGTFAMTSQVSSIATATLTLGNNANIGVAGPGGTPFIAVSNAAGGVTATWSGGVIASQVQVTQPLKALTGILQGVWAWRNYVQAGVGNVAAPFALGSPVGFFFSLNSTNQWTLGAVSISINELPA